MKKVVAFDVSDDKIRRRITKVLLANGFRIQESVFILTLPSRKIKWLQRKLSSIVTDKGIIHIFDLCHSCEKKTIAINAKYERVVIF
jgi:CRISPR-associated protein Cas2